VPVKNFQYMLQYGKQIHRQGLQWLLAIAVSLSLAACQEKSDPEALVIDPDGKGELTLEFDNIVGGTNLALGRAKYKNASGEEYTVDAFNYYVSNIELKKADGTSHKIPNSYFLVRESLPSSQLVTLTDIPQGDYTGVSFVLGVDSTKSVSPVTERTGSLDPGTYGQAVDMYWSWNMGYIFVRLEGTSSAVPTDRNGYYELHTGGFGGMTGKTVNNLRSVAVTTPTPATVRQKIAPIIHILVDVAKVMDGPAKISLTKLYQEPKFNGIHSPDAAAQIGLPDNQKSMFSVDHVHNNPK
jgi:hypothetical protein